MTIRTDLITQIGTNIVLNTNYSVSSTLPFNASEVPLFHKNMKVIYVDKEDEVTEPYLQTLDGTNCDMKTTTVQVYLTTDAKVIPSDIDTVITNCLNAKTAISDTAEVTSGVSTEISDDFITYTFEYQFSQVV